MILASISLLAACSSMQLEELKRATESGNMQKNVEDSINESKKWIRDGKRAASARRLEQRKNDRKRLAAQGIKYTYSNCIDQYTHHDQNQGLCSDEDGSLFIKRGDKCPLTVEEVCTALGPFDE